MSRLLHRMLLGGCTLFALQALQAARAESVTEYADMCTQAVGVAVPAFSCTTAHEIPMVGAISGYCEKPPYLPSARCRKGSRLWVQDTGNPDVAVIGLCRKKGNQAPNDAMFDDIAVIQTNFKNGATCFYQKLDDGGIDGTLVPAPSVNTGDFWYTPEQVRGEECASCHDTGLLRTPYLMQVKADGKPVMPKGRHTTNYWFPGTVLAGWNGKVNKIKDTAPKKNCTVCHAMGANTIEPDLGTSTWLGLLATGRKPTKWLAPPPDHLAHWMKPGRLVPDGQDQVDAQRMSNCAKGAGTHCSIEPWGGQVQAIIDSLRNRKLPALKEPAMSP